MHRMKNSSFESHLASSALTQTTIPPATGRMRMLHATPGKHPTPAPLLMAITLVGLLLLLLSPSRANAATITVSDGPTLVTAVQNAADGDTLMLNGGDYYVPATLEVTGKTITLTGTGSTTIVSDFGSTTPQNIIQVDSGAGLTLNALTVQGGNKNTTGIENHGTLVLNGVTVTKNQNTGIISIYALSITASKPSVTLNNSTVSGNSGPAGGGIYTVGGELVLHNSTVSGNHSQVGGGIFSFGPVTLDNSTVSGNDSTETGFGGGGIFIAAPGGGGGLILKNNSSVHDNHSAGLGGGIFNLGIAVNLDDTSSVYHNRADRGGGIYNDLSGQVYLNGAGSVHDNRADSNGGGIYNSSGTVRLNSTSTVYHNRATGNGGGIVDDVGAVTALYDTSSVYGNRATNGGGIYNNYVLYLYNSSSVHDNRATDHGGGIYNAGGIQQNVDSTVYDNVPDDIYQYVP